MANYKQVRCTTRFDIIIDVLDITCVLYAACNYNALFLRSNLLPTLINLVHYLSILVAVQSGDISTADALSLVQDFVISCTAQRGAVHLAIGTAPNTRLDQTARSTGYIWPELLFSV